LEEDRNIILSEGCDDYLRKPFRENVLFAALEKHLGVRFVTQEIGVDAYPQGDDALEVGREPLSRLLSQDEYAARLAALPAASIDDLREATILGYLDGILASIEQIKTGDPQLGDYLEEQAEAFNQDKILALIHIVENEGADNG
jgi:hypothetical protein